MSEHRTEHDLLIVGAGPVGLALALALADCGYDIALADARARDAAASDPRTLALAYGSRLTLEQLGAWPEVPATAIETIHISQQHGFGRTLLEAGELELPALGYVTAAGALARALRGAVDAAGICVYDDTEVQALTPDGERVIATVRGSAAPAPTLSARLVACAEGGMRSDDADVVERDYGQHALISRVNAHGGHRHTAFERFTASGPLALLPDGDAYAVVHVVAAADADALCELDDASYLALIQHKLGSRVHLETVSARLRYPLLLRYRRTAIGERTVWLGNAAQTLHPVAGQGFNLALRDVMALAHTLREHTPVGDPGDAGTLAAYARARRLDRAGTIGFTDTLVRTFSNDFAPLRHARGAALFALDVFAPARHFLARRMMFGARAWP